MQTVKATHTGSALQPGNLAVCIGSVSMWYLLMLPVKKNPDIHCYGYWTHCNNSLIYTLRMSEQGVKHVKITYEHLPFCFCSFKKQGLVLDLEHQASCHP